MRRHLIGRLLLIIFLVLLYGIEVVLLGMNPLVVVFVVSVFMYLTFRERLVKNLPYRFSHLILLYLVFLFISDIVLRNNRPLYFIPFSLIPMITTIIFSDLEISLIMSLVLAVTLGFQTKSIYWATVLFSSALFSSLASFKARRRFRVIQAGMLAGFIQALSLFLMQNFLFDSPNIYLWLFLNGCVCGIVASGVLPLFEYLFERITNISLLELSDFNNPLLREMILNAPGTYHHSLIVGNLAEAASEAIGADALLSRVGAYYHDIGKIKKPQYFIENQSPGEGYQHEELSPSISKMVIVNHVRDGVELAKRYKLNKRIIDFIQQHHGTSIVYYFYLKALQNTEEPSSIDDEVFRYPGPKPKSRETAVVLLADSVEAASRTLREPTPAKITELVHRIINNKFIDGQLDECELTLKDLEKISEVFIRILTSMYHARITYPQKEDFS